MSEPTPMPGPALAPPHVMMGAMPPGVGYALGNPAPPARTRVTFEEPNEEEKGEDVKGLVMVATHAAWKALLENVPIHMREGSHLFDLHEDDSDGQPRTGFLTQLAGPMMDLESNDEDDEDDADQDPEKARRRKEKREKRQAAAREAIGKFDQLFDATGMEIPGQPPRTARIPVSEMTGVLYLVALSRCDRPGLERVARHMGIDTENRESWLEYAPATKEQLVVLLRLLAPEKGGAGWLDFRLAGRWYLAPAEVVVTQPHQFADALGVVVRWAYRIGAEILPGGARMRILDDQQPVPLRDVLAKHKLRVRPLKEIEADSTLDEFGAWRETAQYTTRDVRGECIELIATANGPKAVEWPMPEPEDGVVVVDEPEAWSAMGDDEGYRPGQLVRHSVEDTFPAQLPIMRVFSLRRKQWLYADYRCLVEHQWHGNLLSKVVLPEGYSDTIRRVAASLAAKEQSTSDILPGRHGGIVILEEGPTGTGKTATAEALADAAKRPVYEVSAWDLVEGSTARSPYDPPTMDSEGLEPIARVFGRASRWNAVLLVDEADVIFSHRTASDLERSAVVGRFLHLAETFSGVLILTTNLPGTIDDAVISRCSLVIPYPPLEADSRQKVWELFFSRQELKEALPWAKELAAIECNGRQIRSAVRMAMLGREKPALEHFKAALDQTMPKWGKQEQLDE